MIPNEDTTRLTGFLPALTPCTAAVTLSPNQAANPLKSVGSLSLPPPPTSSADSPRHSEQGEMDEYL